MKRACLQNELYKQDNKYVRLTCLTGRRASGHNKRNYLRLKKILFYLAIGIMASYLVVSCETDDASFDEALLTGKWLSDAQTQPDKNTYYKYLANGTGATWDTDDDVTEEEAQEFTWTLVKSKLTHIHILEMGGVVPKVYTVTELTASTLEYYDDFKSYSYSKVSK